MSYADLAARAGALAAGLQALEPEPQSRVGICCFNHVEHVVAWLAVLAAGKVWVPLYPKNKAAEIGLGISFTEASIVIADATALPLVEGAGAAILVPTRTGRRHDWRPRPGPCGRGPSLPRAATPRDAGHQVHRRDHGQAQRSDAALPGLEHEHRDPDCGLGLKPGERLLAAAPITHGTSTYILPTLGTGGTLVLRDQPRPEEVLRCFAEERIATTFLPPTVIYMMMELPAARRNSYPHLRNLVYGSAAMRPDAIAQAQSVFGRVSPRPTARRRRPRSPP